MCPVRCIAWYRPQRPLHLLGAVRRRVRVLGARQTQRLVAGAFEEPLACLRERCWIEPVQGLVTIRGALASPDLVEERAWGRRRHRRSRPEAPLPLDARPDAVHEDREFLHVLRAIRQPLPRAVARGAGHAAGEGRERNSAHAARQQQLERVDRVLHDGPLVDAVAQPVERLSEEAREGERGVEGAAEVRSLDAQVRQFVHRAQHVVAPLTHVRRGPPQRRQRALQRRERPVLGERGRSGDEPRGQVREDFAGADPVRADLVGDHEPARTRPGRSAEHVHLGEARQRHDPVAPLGIGERGVHEPAEVVEPLVYRVVEHVAAMPHGDSHQLLDQLARIDASGRVVGIVDDHRGDAAAGEQTVQFLGIWQEARRLGGQFHHLLAGALDEPVVLPARPRHDHAGTVGAEHLEHDRETRARARREQDLVGLEADLRVRVVEQAVAVEELGDFAADVHASDGRAVAVDGIPGDALGRAHDLRVGCEVRVLVVALRQVQGTFLLDAPREHPHERLGRGQGAGGETPGRRVAGRFRHRVVPWPSNGRCCGQGRLRESTVCHAARHPQKSREPADPHQWPCSSRVVDPSGPSGAPSGSAPGGRTTRRRTRPCSPAISPRSRSRTAWSDCVGRVRQRR